jgi:hypothetical protein
MIVSMVWRRISRPATEYFHVLRNVLSAHKGFRSHLSSLGSMYCVTVYLSSSKEIWTRPSLLCEREVPGGWKIGLGQKDPVVDVRLKGSR